jgi:ATP-binding cassette subfamily B protein
MRNRSGKATLEDEKTPINPKVALQQIIPYLVKYRLRIFLGLSVLVSAKLATIGVPIVMKYLVDGVSGELSAESLWFFTPLVLVIAYGALRFLNTLFGELRDYIFSTVDAAVNHDLAQKIFTHLHQLSLRFHLSRKTGNVTREIDHGLRGFSTLFSGLLYNIFPTILEFILAASYLAYNYSARFVVILLIALVSYILYTVVVTQHRLKQFRLHNSLVANTQSMAVDSLINYETVKYFNNEEMEAKRYGEADLKVARSMLKNRATLSFLNLGQSLIVAIALTFMLREALLGVERGVMTVGDLVLVNTLLLQLVIPLNFLGTIYRMLREAFTDVERMFILLGSDAEVKDKPDAAPLAIKHAGIRFDNVAFAYDAARPILKGVDIELPAGTTTAIVGHSGSGKSTLARLLYRFYDVSSGQILIDEQPITSVTQKSLRQAIGIVPQDTVLFNDTLYYNIAYGRPNATEAEVHAAAASAQLDRFINSLPEGYQTQVGERGLKLSGGEKQRVAIARAILKQPRIMIFDEATSALDSRTEQSIQQALEQVAAEHTTLIIAHRLSTIAHADQIVVLEEGEVVEVGKHQQLLAKKGTYATLWEIQQHHEDDALQENLPVSSENE